MTKFEEGVRQIDKTLTGLNIKYAFLSGTALGLCRTGKCLDFDVDIDFAIHHSDLHRLKEIEQGLGFTRISKQEQENFGYEFGVLDWAELDILHTGKTTVWHAWQQGSQWIANVYPKRMWDNLEHIYAYGVKCPVFHPIEEYLERTYGKDWKVERRDFNQTQLDRITETRKYNWDFRED
jgi:phosphorylcholine metabolism protein LicD